MLQMLLTVVSAGLLAAATPPPAGLDPYIKAGIFDPGNYGWMRGQFPEASPVDRQRFKAVQDWLARCATAEQARIVRELAGMGAAASKLPPAPYQDALCRDIASAGVAYDGWPSFAAFSADLKTAGPIADAFLWATTLAVDVGGPKETDLAQELLARPLGEQILRFGLLAGAGSFIVGAAPGFGNGDVVRNKIINGIDLTGSDNDGFVAINFATPFQLDPNAPVASGEVDFFSVLDHEFTHLLGFQSIFSITDTPGVNYQKFDQFLTTRAGVRLVDPITLMTNSAALADARANGALFDGPNASAAFPGGVPIEAENDLSHLNVNFFTVRDMPRNALMLSGGNPFGPDQSEPRDYNSSEIGILTDLGYTRTSVVGAVPEPATWAMMVFGFGMMGATLRRRKAVVSFA